MRRRDLIAMLGGVAVMLPFAAGAQQPDRMRRVGVLIGGADDAAEQPNLAAFVQSLAQLGWTDHRNIEVQPRWAGGDSRRMEDYARELVGLAPDAIVCTGATMPALRKATSTIPVVFVVSTDTLAQDYVKSFARPAGNMTGFTSNEGSLVGKRLEMLKELSPSITRVLYIRGSRAETRILFLRLASDARASGLAIIDGPAENGADIEGAVASFSHEPNAGLVIAFDAFTTAHGEKIVELAAGYRLPAVYPFSFFAESGGLLSYGMDQKQQFRQAASYVDRILKGAKPADLPVQQPTKFELVINLKTAKAFGLAVPPTLLAQADEVIE